MPEATRSALTSIGDNTMPIIARRALPLDAAKKEAEQDARIDALEAQLSALLNAIGVEEDEAEEGETDLDGNPVPKERGQHDSL